VVGYFSKWQGSHGKDPACVPSLRHSFISLLQAALSITVLSFLDTGLHTEPQDVMFLVASFGATAVLLYSSHTSPLAQPRNVLVGHFVSSVAGVTVYKVRKEVWTRCMRACVRACIGWVCWLFVRLVGWRVWSIDRIW
jgi:CBS-domain-containing membrane protein